MKRERILRAALLWLIVPAVCAAAGQRDHLNIKQVRVIAERASVYIEPSRGSTRIDIVAKGDLLNLLQTKKVKGNWYYVSYSSSRYGARVSGFVLDSTVELVGAAILPVPEIKRPEEKPATTPPPPPVRTETKAREEPKPEPPPPPRIKESLAATSLPNGLRMLLTPVAPPVERPWRAIATTEPPEKPVETESNPPVQPLISEAIIPTAVPNAKQHSFPRGAQSLQDPPWKIEEPVPTEPEGPKPKPEPPPEKPIEAKPKAEPVPKAPPEKVTPPPESKEKQAPPSRIARPSRLPGVRKSPGGISIALGYGSSFGGAGACFQISTNRGIALHAGAGVFPTRLIYSETDWVKNKTLWSVGLKYFLPIRSSLFYPYIDVQYGGLRVEAAQAVVGIWDYDYVYRREQKALWGPSVLAGLELRKGGLGVCGALGVSYATTSWDFLQDKVALTFDTSLVVHF